MRFKIELDVNLDPEAPFLEALGNPSSDLMYEIQRALNELDDIKLNEIIVRKEDIL